MMVTAVVAMIFVSFAGVIALHLKLVVRAQLGRTDVALSSLIYGCSSSYRTPYSSTNVLICMSLHYIH